MAKKKTDEKKKKEKEDFNIQTSLETVNPFILDGFKRFISNKEIKSEKEFNNLLEEYGGL